MCEDTMKSDDISQLHVPGFSGTQGSTIVKTGLNACVCCLAENVPFVKLSNCKHDEFFDCIKMFKLQYQLAVVCYACHGMLKDIYQFKRQVIDSVTRLNTKIPPFEHNNIKLSNLTLSNVEIYFITNSDSFDKEIKVIEPKIEIKIEHDNSDPENDVPLSEIKETANKNETSKYSPYNLLGKYEGKIKCILLSETEMWEERKRDAAKEKFLKLLYRCDNCIVGYDHELTLKEHMEKRHGQIKGGFTCAICTSVLTTLESYKQHMRRHYRRVECMACGARYSTVVSATTHYSKMHDPITETYKCDKCEFTTTSNRRYRYHRASHKQKPQCADCGKSFVNNSGLKVHMYTVHKVSDRVYSCSECSKTYATRSGLLAHTEAAHDPRGAFCVPCRTHFRTAHNLRHHLNTHRAHTTAAHTRYACTSCDARFFTKAQLSAHVDWEHLKKIKHKCDECNKAFKTHNSLKRHIDYVHEKKRPPRNKMCDHCGRGFTTMSILRAHIRTHTGERPHACAHCAAAFAHPAALYTHNKLLHKNK